MTLSEAEIMGGILDDAAHAIYDTIAASGLLDVDEVKAAGNKTTPIKAKKISIIAARIDAAGIDPLVDGWFRYDREASGKHAGGRNPLLTRRQVLIMALTLADERTPLLISEYANAFHTRLTKKARVVLGVDHLIDTGDPKRDYQRWYMRVARMLYGTIGTFDAWPAPRRLLERKDREKAKSEGNRPAAMVALKEPRAREFTNTMLEMSLRALPLEYQEAWKGALSADQSAIAAPSQAMPWRRDHEKPGSPEVFDEIEVERDGKMVWEEAKKPVMEIDATPYPRDKGRQDKDFNGPIPDFQMSYAANLMMTVNDPETPDAHPQLIAAASLHQFGRSIGEHTMSNVDSLIGRGWNVRRLSVDRGYNAGIEMDAFHIPLAQRGIGLVVDYKRHQLGPQKETIHGALEVEGDLLCPATPLDLRTLSLDARDGSIAPKEYFIKIEERKKYRARPLSQPDAQGGARYYCPARRQSATVTCPLVELHAKASPNVHRPHIDEDLIPVHPDLFCTKESVMVEWNEGLATKQELTYASREWLTVDSHDRQSMEGMNAYLKRIHGLEDADRRMMRGLAAQSFILTMVLTAANFARINKFLHDRAAGVVTEDRDRNRDKQGYSNYHRFYTKPKRRRGMTLKEKRAAAAKPVQPAATTGTGRRRGRKPIESS